MLPAVTVAVGNATALRINPRLPAETVTAKGTPGRGRVPSSMSTVAVPLKVALPSAPTAPLWTSPSTMTFCGVPRGEVPRSTALELAHARLQTNRVYPAATNQVGDRVALYHGVGVSLKLLENTSSGGGVLGYTAVTPVSKKHKPPNERPTVCTL